MDILYQVLVSQNIYTEPTVLGEAFFWVRTVGKPFSGGWLTAAHNLCVWVEQNNNCHRVIIFSGLNSACLFTAHQKVPMFLLEQEAVPRTGRRTAV